MFNKIQILLVIILFSLLFIMSCQSLLITSDEDMNDYLIKTEVQEKINDANYYMAIGDLDRARDSYKDIIEWDETGYVDVPEDLIAEIYATIGILYEYEMELIKASKYYERSLNIYRKINFIEESFIIAFYIARIDYYLVDYPKAIEYLDLSISFYESKLDKKNTYQSIVLKTMIYFNIGGPAKTIEYLESILNSNVFEYNHKEELNIMYMLAMYYQRHGDYESYNLLTEKIKDKINEYNIKKTSLDYFIHSDIYNNINHGNYNLALGILMMSPITDQNYFEILRIHRLIGQESNENIPINADYFDEFPKLYAALFSIEAGYIESYMVNFQSGLNKISKSVDFFRINNDNYHLAEGLYAKGMANYKHDNYQKSINNFLESKELYRKLGLFFEESLSVKYSGMNLLKLGDTERALNYLKDASINFENLNNYFELAPIYEYMSIIYNRLSEDGLRTIYLNKAIDAYKKIGNNDKVEELENLL